MPEPSKPRTTIPAFALVVGAMVAVAAVVLLVVRASNPGDAPAAPAGPPMANIDIVSDPVGCSVYHADGGALIGIAPLVISVPQTDKEMVIVTKHEGYQDRRSTVPLYAASGRIDIELIRIGEKERVVKPPPDALGL